MKKIVVILSSIILVVAASVGIVFLLSAQHSDNLQDKLKDIYIQDMPYGNYKDNPNDVEIVGYKKIGNKFHAIDLQLLNVGHGARYGININRVVFEIKDGEPKLITIMPDAKAGSSKPKATEVLPENLLQQITDWPLSPSIYENTVTAFDFYSGDLTEVSRTKLMNYFIGATVDTRTPNMSVRKGSYAKTEDQKSTIDTLSHSHSHEKTFIRPAITTTFILDIKHPKSSYKVTQKAHKEAPSRDTLYFSCVDGGSGNEDEVNCSGDTRL